MRLLGLLAGFLLLALVGTRVGLADSSERTRTLQPGDNLIGWVGEPVSIAELFEQLPQAELVYAWDAEEQRFRFAAPAGVGDLTAIEPGMGLFIRIAGTEDAAWEPRVAESDVTIQLQKGFNFVAWVGDSDVGLAEALAEIVAYISSVSLWDIEQQRFHSYDPREGGPPPTLLLSPGDALHLNVRQAVAWEHPRVLTSRRESLAPQPQPEPVEDTTWRDDPFGAGIEVDPSPQFTIEDTDGCTVQYNNYGFAVTDSQAYVTLIMLSQIPVSASDAARVLREAVPHYCDPQTVRGAVTTNSGRGLPGLRVAAVTQGMQGSSMAPGTLIRSEGVTDEDGYFDLVFPRNEEYIIEVDLGDWCFFWKGRRITAHDPDRIRPMMAAVSVSPWIDVRVPDDACSRTISGRMIDQYGNSMAGNIMQVRLDSQSYLDKTNGDGAFEITVPYAGRYQLTATLVAVAGCANCMLHYGHGHVVSEQSEAVWLKVLANSDGLSDVEFRLDEHPLVLCGVVVESENNAMTPE